MISLKNVTCGYGKEPVHQNVSLDIEPGDVLMITGPNGVGKSTILKVLAGVLLPAKGSVEYEWPDVKDPRQFIGYLPDSLSIYRSMKVNNLSRLHWDAFGMKNQALPLLQKASIDPSARISDLSVGQRVIFHLDLILSTKPRLILIDEVLHSVDSYLRGLALEAIVETIADRNPTVVMVNLNYTTVEHLVNRVVFLSKKGITLDERAETLIERAEIVTERETGEKKLTISDSSVQQNLKLTSILTHLIKDTYKSQEALL